jgi:hypothetical protein
MIRIGPSPHFGLRHAGRALACLALVSLAGCSADEPIEQYRVPKEPDRGTRMLTAVFSRPDATWFIKLAGPKAAVAEVRETFEQFTRSVQFPDGKAIDWTLPTGWKREEGNSEMRFATLRLESPSSEKLEVSVTKLGADPGSLLSNVNRWRGQIGLSPIPEDRLSEAVAEKQTDQKVAYKLVDFSGPGKPRGNMSPPPPPPAVSPTPAGRGDPFAFEIPQGWKEVQPSQPRFTLRELRAGDGGDAPAVTFSILGGNVGANLNRWRAQVGLPELSPDDLAKETTPIEVAKQMGILVDFAGAGGASAKRIVGVIVPHGEQSVFIKMTGNTGPVGTQRPTFERFIQSVQIRGEQEAQP